MKIKKFELFQKGSFDIIRFLFMGNKAVIIKELILLVFTEYCKTNSSDFEARTVNSFKYVLEASSINEPDFMID